ncbi:MAG: acyl-CoA dehydrogenase family protein [Haloarculaceae archaeon]|jgi:alkylation response protein AidB-like acyl-CoA dehydrogenase
MLELSEEQRMLVEETERIAENEFAERAFTWEGEEHPEENLQTLADRGFLGINLPMEYGGGGMSEFDVALQVETIGRVCPDTAAAVYGMSMVGPRAIEMFGSEAAKERYLPKVTSGETSIAIAISEPEAGSDSQNMVTSVEEADDGELYLNGEKIWVSGVKSAEAAVVWTKFPEGLGTVVMEFDQPGVEIAQHFTNMHGGTQTQFYMEDVHIPEDRVLVRGPQALKEQLKALNWERCGSSMLANSIGLNAFDKAVEYAQDREQFDQPISEFQGMRWKIADMAKRLEAARALTYRAAGSADDNDGAPDRLQTAIAKLFSSETVEHVVSEALQVHGANGYQQGHPLEYLYRLARGRRIAAGTDEIQKNNIADVVFDRGLPRTL